MVDVWLPYGKTEVCVRIQAEDLLGIVKPKGKTGDPQSKIEEALKKPINIDPLEDIAKSKRNICIVMNHTLNSPIMEAAFKTVIKELHRAGVKNQNVKAVIGYDPIRKRTSNERIGSYAGDIEGVNIAMHDPINGEFTGIGETSLGTEVYVDKHFLTSDLRITIGLVEPHPYMGYSGRDGILPGISKIETIRQSLSRATDPNANPGTIKNNPIQRDIREAIEMAEVDFSLYLIKEANGNLVEAFSGEPRRAFQESVKVADETFKRPVEERTDIIIMSPGGHPNDISLYEACKHINNIQNVMRKDSTVTLIAECSTGHGDDNLHNWLDRIEDQKRLEKSLKRQFSPGCYIAYLISKTLQKSELILVSAIPEYYIPDTADIKIVRTANEALRYALSSRKRKTKIMVLPHGNLTIPTLKKQT